MATTEPRICQGGSGLWLPLGGDWERDLPTGAKVVLYLMGLLYCFLGVAIIADVFMASIEKITSIKKQIVNKDTGKKTTVKVWNDTVANLTLMALGSSAPEILLSIIELVGNNFYSGDLGASTIVGSAAFNLLGITGVCIAALPDGEIKLIKDRKVFAITGSFSVFAYLWLLIILVGFSKDMVEPWEGVVTFLYFPLLVILSYMADIGMFGKMSRTPSSHIVWSEATPEQLAELMMQVRRDFGDNLSQEQILAALHYESHKHRSRAQYRVAAVRDISAGRKVMGINDKMRNELEATRALGRMTNEGKSLKAGPIVEFTSSQYSVLESVGTAKFGLIRTGDCSVPVTVLWKTRCGSAQAGKDFKMQEGNVTFEKGETDKVVSVEIIDDEDYEDDQEFYMEIYSAVADNGNVEAVIGDKREATVVIVDDDLPGILGFVAEEIKVEESPQMQQVEIKIRRKMGASGTVTCKYRTEDASAKAGPDYSKLEGELTFLPGQMEACVYVDIMPKGRYESTEKFRVILEKPDEGDVRFDATTDGGSDSCVCTVWIMADVSHKPFMDKIVSSLSPNWDEVALGNAAWLDQFWEALYCGGDKEEQSKCSWFEFVLHVLSLPWKLIFALVPPTEYCGGWLCFVLALAMIGCVTIIIGDLASLLGCSMDINDLQTAITLVAMGTSLPDTFASRTAARQDEYADASIGNVTGSNSVNVFLGIGLPWMIGAIYWRFAMGATDEWQARIPPGMADLYPDGGLYVSSEGLSFSVSVFSACAIVCFAVLVFRRHYFGGELGGPKAAQYVSAGILSCLWAIYIGLSIWYTST